MYKGRIFVENEILIADDQEGVRLLLHDILSHEGYPVTAVTNGKEALEHLQSNAFAVVILDYHLPVMNGLDILGQMENTDVHTPAIVITGMKEIVESELAEDGSLEALEVDVLAKPFDIQDVSTRVKDLVQEKERC